MTFEEFFRALHDKEPFPWQRRLAARVTEGNWPRLLALPTASGKTACIEIAVYALASQHNWPRGRRTAPRRVFFVVDRRVIVDEAYDRMCEIAEKLRQADSGILKEVAGCLRRLSGDPDGRPLIVHELRGGIYRDDAWIRNPAQPALIASTVDQVGSRLLFRGYGVSESTQPIHAALIGNDALIVLDEAHCSRPFGQTLESVRKYREQGGVAERLRMPFHVVEMSATPSTGSAGNDVFKLSDEDREPKYLGPRLKASKPTDLVQAGKKQGKSDRDVVAEVLIEQALQLTKQDSRLKNIAIFANRVATARAVHRILTSQKQNAELLVGRMRPVDRDDLTARLRARLKSGEKDPPEDILFVASTQCLEVGADFDFDALVSECASIDALRQRFGRLNRLGRENIQARAVIVAPPGKLDGDPIYGDAIAHVWDWLNSIARDAGGQKAVVNFAIEGAGTVGEALQNAPVETFENMRSRSVNAPVLFREYLDLWSQTNPAPTPEPEIGLFLHGTDRDSNEVQVVWRADLDDDHPEEWLRIVSLCPPVMAEAMPVPLSAFRRWLRHDAGGLQEIADVAAVFSAHGRQRSNLSKAQLFLQWRGGRRSRDPRDLRPEDLRPGDTVVIPASHGGWEELGHRPEKAFQDRAEEAILSLKRNPLLRVRESVISQYGDEDAPAEQKNALEDLSHILRENEPDAAAVHAALSTYRDNLAEGQWPKQVLAAILDLKRVEWTPYPDGHGFVLRARRGTVGEEDDGEDDLSAAEDRLALDKHTGHVTAWVAAFVERCGLDEFASDFAAAARCHDWGKADERFQALLLGGDHFAARFSPKLWAKSSQMALSIVERRRQWQLSGLPDGFRHELLSLQLAESGKAALDGDRDLILHLIATHHGWARPLAPVVEDDHPTAISLRSAGEKATWTSQERVGMIAPDRLGSGVADRFWALTHLFGWWGLAYLETVFRLGDWTASKNWRVPEQRSEGEAA